jgi:hypothetical protein
MHIIKYLLFSLTIYYLMKITTYNLIELFTTYYLSLLHITSAT